MKKEKSTPFIPEGLNVSFTYHEGPSLMAEGKTPRRAESSKVVTTPSTKR